MHLLIPFHKVVKISKALVWWHYWGCMNELKACLEKQELIIVGFSVNERKITGIHNFLLSISGHILITDCHRQMWIAKYLSMNVIIMFCEKNEICHLLFKKSFTPSVCIFVISYGHAFGIALFVDNVINLIKLSSSTEL